MIGDRLHNLANLMTMQSPDMLYNYLISQWGTPTSIVKNLQSFPGGCNLTNNTITFKQQSFTEKMMVADTLAYLPDDILVKVDRASMANSLETRASFLDHELVEFVWRLPLSMKIRNSQTKWLLRKVLEKYIPEHLLERPKMGFGIPLDLWLRGSLRDWAESLLDKNKLEQHGMLNSNVIIKKWQEHLSGKCNRQYQLWSVLMFQAWMENTQHGD
jgi:asparagine synthase (glutamine-hydrolysing)